MITLALSALITLFWILIFAYNVKQFFLDVQPVLISPLVQDAFLDISEQPLVPNATLVAGLVLQVLLEIVFLATLLILLTS